MGPKWLGVVAGAVLIGGWSFAVAQQAEPPPAAPSPQGEEMPHPFEPILVQGYVKSVDEKQLTLTAPGAPVDLPLSLREETRYIQGENDVARSSLAEGQLVRAALLPVGDDLVALVVEVVPDEAPQQPGAPAGGGGTGAMEGAGGAGGLQGDLPPATPSPIEPGPGAPAPDGPESLPPPDPRSPGGDAKGTTTL